MRDVLVLVAIGLGTYGFRVAWLMTTEAQQPATLQRMLPYVGPAVLAAITWLLWRRTAGLLVPLVSGLATWSLLAALVSV